MEKGTLTPCLLLHFSPAFLSDVYFRLKVTKLIYSRIDNHLGSGRDPLMMGSCNFFIIFFSHTLYYLSVKLPGPIFEAESSKFTTFDIDLVNPR